MRTLVPTLVILGLCLPASALEQRISELRFGVGTLPMPDAAQESYDAGSGSTRAGGDYDYDGNTTPGVSFRIGAAGGRLQPVGLILGLDLQGGFGVYDLSGGNAPNQRDLTYWCLVPTLRAGLGWALSTRAHIELTPLVGYGLASTQWTDGGSTETSIGGILTYGITATVMQNLGRGFSAGIEVGYLWSQTSVSVTNGSTNGSSSVDLDASGPTASLLFGYGF